MKNLVVTVFLAIQIFGSQAQSFSLRGTVVNEKDKPMKGVTVYVKETGKNEIFTNAEGKFKIPLSDTTKQKTIVFSFSGYKKQEYPINTKENDIRIVMVEGVDTESFDVRVKKESTGAISVEVVAGRPIFEADMAVKEERSSAAELKAVSVVEGVAEDRVAGYEKVSLRDAKGSPSSFSPSNIKSGMLTSGEVNDFAKWHLWGGILKNDFRQ